MGFPEPNGSKYSNLSLPLIHRSHHVGEDDQTSDEKDNDRDPNRKLLEMSQSLRLGLEGLVDRCHFSLGQFLRDLTDDLFDRTGIAKGRDFDQAQSPRFLHFLLGKSQSTEDERVIF